MAHIFTSEQSAQLTLFFTWGNRQLCYNQNIPRVMTPSRTGKERKLHRTVCWGEFPSQPPPSRPENPPIPRSAPATMLKQHSLLTQCLLCTEWFGIVPAVPLGCKLLGTGTCYVLGTLHLLYSAVYSSAI